MGTDKDRGGRAVNRLDHADSSRIPLKLPQKKRFWSEMLMDSHQELDFGLRGFIAAFLSRGLVSF